MDRVPPAALSARQAADEYAADLSRELGLAYEPLGYGNGRGQLGAGVLR